MKYFKKFLLLGIFTLFGVCFCSAGKITYNGVANQYKMNATNFGPLILNSRGGPIDYECCFSNFSGTSSFNNKTINLQFKKKGDSAYTTIKSFNSSVIINNECVNGTYNGNYMTDSFYITLYFPYVGSLNSYNTTYSCSFSGDAIFVEEDTNYYLSSYLSLLTGDNNGTTCDTGTILSGYILESSVNSQYCVNNGLCPSCPDQYTSLQCQEEYNLIPINDVNENYCTLNFDLISPSDCPSSPSGSGTSRSAFYINNNQYLGSPSIYLNIPEIIDRRYTYNSGNMIVDVEGYYYDTGYINDILTIQEYHPSSEDFTVAFVSFLTLGLPYVVVVLFVVFIRKLIRKIFKS